MFRELFPVTKNLIYLNHAAVGPLSVPACEAMERHVRDQRDFGALHWKAWYAEYDRARESAARLIGAQPSEIAILKNTSEGLSFIAGGLRWNEGDNVVTTAMEFPSNWTPWKRLESRGVECRVAMTPTIVDVAPLIDARTRLVSVSSVAFHNGFTAELEALGAICSARNVAFCVDAIQSVGVLPMDVRRWKIDFLAADAHKWICGPEGAAIFYVAAERRDELEPLEIGWWNIDRKGKFIGTSTEWLPDARRYEAGSLNTAGVFGFRAAIDLLLEVGVDTISARALSVANALADGLESIGWRVDSQRPLRSPIVAAIPPQSSQSLLWWHRQLEEQRIVCAPREEMLRFSPHFYNEVDEAECVVRTIRHLAG